MKMPEKVRLSVDLIGLLRTYDDEIPRRVEDLAAVLGTSKNFLHQSVCALSKAGIIKVVRGPSGGVLPVVHSYSMLDVYRALGYMKEPIVIGTTSSTFEKELRDFLGAWMF